MNLNEVVSVKNMRESDAHTIAEHTTSAELMHRAAQGILMRFNSTARLQLSAEKAITAVTAMPLPAYFLSTA